MQNTKLDYCPFCSTQADLHPLEDTTGKVWWACKTGSAVTCYDVWKKQVEDPLTFTIGDF
jgi:hypothetical protein